MKRLLIILCAFFVVNVAVFSQAENKLTGDVTMPSPEAASLGKYVDIPVGYYTGTPNISLPIHTVVEGKLNLPITLSNHASGLRVAESASWVGHGWSLNTGGRVMRTVIGLPDDHLGGYFTSGSDIQNIPEMDVNNYPLSNEAADDLIAIQNGQIDGEADLFSFNFAGYTGKFYYDENEEPVLLPKQNIQITKHERSSDNHIVGFTFLAPNGTKYYFGVPDGNISATPVMEETQQALSSGYTNAQATSWMLVKMKSFDNADVINLNYTSEEYIYRSPNSCTLTSLNNLPGSSCHGFTENRVNTFRISSISYTFGAVNFLVQDKREDLSHYSHTSNLPNTYRLHQIRVDEGRGIMCKNFTFSYDYWQDNSTYKENLPEDKRLKLLSVQEKACDNSESIPPYIFSYYGDGGDLPNRLSKAIDHWGYYNGADQNNDFAIDRLNVPPINSAVPSANGWVEITYDGKSDRESNGDYMKLGTLKDIGYPTGGKHTFTFEANEVNVLQQNTYIDELINLEHPGCAFTSSVSSSIDLDFTEIINAEVEFIIEPIESGCTESTTDPYELDLLIFELVGGNYTQIGSKYFWHYGNATTPKVISETFGQFFQSIITTSGKYRFDIVPRNNNTAPLRSFLKIENVTEIEEFVDWPVGGVRVNRIDIDDGNGNIITKTYRYDQDEAPNAKSSGVLYNRPQYWFSFYNIEVMISPTGGPGGGPVYGFPPSTGSHEFFEHSVVPLSNFEGAHFGYSRVVEDHQGIGWKEFQFITEPGPTSLVEIYQFPEYPFPPEQLKIDAGNQEYAATYDVAENKVEESITTALSANYEYGTSQMVKASTGLPGVSATWTNYTVRTRIPYLVQQTDYTIDGITKTTQYEYDGIDGTANEHYFPTAVSFNNNDGQHRTEYQYAVEASISCLLSSHILNQPVAERKFVGGTLVGGYSKGYTGCFPTSYYEILADGSGNESQLLRGQISAYNSLGLPEDYQAMGFPIEDYTWNGRLLTDRDYESWNRNYKFYGSHTTRFLQTMTELDGQEVSYTYDKLGRLKTVSSRGGNIVTTYTYSIGSTNSITKETQYSDAPTQTFIEEFDGLGRHVKTTHNSIIKDEKIYDNYGRIDKQLHLVGNFSDLEYEESPLKRLTENIFPDGNSIRTIYGNQNGYFKTETIDEKGNATTVLTEIIGRKAEVIDAINGSTTYEYDLKGNIKEITPPEGSPYLYTYDIRNRLTSKKIPGQDNKQVFRYDDATDLLEFSIDANGNRLDYEYDNYGREETVKLNELGLSFDPDNPNTFGSSGQLIISNTYGEGTGITINYGKMMSQDVARIDDMGIGGMLTTDYQYDAFGRVDKEIQDIPLQSGTSQDVQNYIYNHLDWITNEYHIHTGYVSFNKVTSHVYDQFGREISRVFGGGPGGGGAVALTMTYNDRDQMTSKKYGSLGGYDYLERVEYAYRFDRGWLMKMNDLFHDLEDKELCEPSVWNDKPYQVEDDVSLIELLEIISQGDVIDITGIDPCEEPVLVSDCRTNIADYFLINEELFPVNVAGNNTITYNLTNLYTNYGELPLNYPYQLEATFSNGTWTVSLNEASQLKTDIESWLDTSGFLYDQVNVSFYIGKHHGSDTRGQIKINIDILGTNAGFTINTYTSSVTKFSKTAKFTKDNIQNGVPCKNIPLIGALTEQSVNSVNDLNFPTALYKVTESSGQSYWKFKEELFGKSYNYTRQERMKVPDANLQLEITDTLGVKHTGGLALFIEMNSQGKVDYFDPLTTGCTQTPPNCTTYQQEQQALSMVEIMNAMANLSIEDITFPTSIHLVQLCDGSFVYIIDDLLGDLAGSYNLIDELVITDPDQLITILILEKKPLFAMTFDHEANGNIEEMKWKVTDRQAKFYQLTYDQLNRLTNAEYGIEYLEEVTNPGSPPALTLNTDFTNDYKVTNIGYDGIGNIESLDRYGMIPNVDCFDTGIIDKLSYTYTNDRLQKVEDNASNPYKPSGFKPNTSSSTGDYQYDKSGNLTLDWHKSLTISYNHLNLPSKVIGSGGTVEWLYDALGRKWRKTGPEGTKEYFLGIEYADQELEGLYDVDGRMVPMFNETRTSILEMRPEYWHKDHLGNTRLAFSDFNKNNIIEYADVPGTSEEEGEITQENHYYPFGLHQTGDWYATISPENQYQYNGKELNTDLGLNWNDYGARWYDPEIGRWGQIDPLAEDFYFTTPYNYVFNNPVNVIDPDGMAPPPHMTPDFWNNKNGNKRSRNPFSLYTEAPTGINWDQIFNNKPNILANGDPVKKGESIELDDGSCVAASCDAIEVSATYTGPAFRESEPNFFERVNEKGGFAGSLVYGLSNDAWLTFQRFNPFDTHTTHLAGHYANKSEYQLAILNTSATIVPFARGTGVVKNVVPKGFTVLKPLNAIQYSKLFKGTFFVKGSLARRGLFNRTLNSGIGRINKPVETGTVLFSATKKLGKSSNE